MARRKSWLLLYGAIAPISTLCSWRVFPATTSRKTQNANANHFQSRHVHHFIVVHVVDLAVRNKEKVGPANRPCRWQDTEIAAIFKDGCARHAKAIAGKTKCRDARRSDAVLNANQTAVVPIEAVDSRERASRPRINVTALPICEVYSHHAQTIRYEQRAIILAKRNAVGIKERAMNPESRESASGGIEPQHRVCQAIRCNHLAVLADDQIIEAVFRRTLRLEASQQFSSGIKMQELRSPAVREGIGPYRVIAGADSNSQDRQKSIAVRWYEIGTLAVSANFHNFPAIEAAEVKNIPLRIVGQSFRNQVFLRGPNCFVRLRHDRKIPMHIFDLRRQFLRFFKLQEGRIAGRIESLLQCETFFQERQGLAALS